ncbi:centrosome-associated protein 350-like isoform X2 [Actinia tenebrosa]|uniref:Centrosome-associated protein 350-like isoform X2 n=1 Tax=Actinia tenebrosa TaxID=6105 RepID=A0A6P8I0L0_ACTTE|nr:centrosome-associated protein 350-like isoform X2 [Actinia tenebrosa]
MTSTGLFRGRRVADPVPIQRGSLTRETRSRSSLNDLAAAWDNVDEVRTALQAAEARIQEAKFELGPGTKDQENLDEPIVREVFSQNQRLGRVSRYELRPTVNKRDYSRDEQNSSLTSSSHSSIDIPLYHSRDVSRNSHISTINNSNSSNYSGRQHSPPTRDFQTKSPPYINNTEAVLDTSTGDQPRFSKSRESSRIHERPVLSDMGTSNFEDSLEMSSFNRRRLDAVRPLSSLGLKPVVANNSEALARLKERIKQQKQKAPTSTSSRPTHLENGDVIIKPSKEDVPYEKDTGISTKPLSKRKVAAGPTLSRYKGFSEPGEPYKVSVERQRKEHTKNGNKRPIALQKPASNGYKTNKGGVKIQRITAPKRPTNTITTTSWRSGQETVKKVLGPTNTRPKSTASNKPQSNASQDTTSTSSRMEKLEWKKEERDKTKKLSTPVEDMEIKWEVNGIEKKDDERDSEEDDIKEVDELSQHTLDLNHDDDDDDDDTKLDDVKESRVLSEEAKNILSDLDIDSESDNENQPDTVQQKAKKLAAVKEAKAKRKKSSPNKMSPGKKRKAPSSNSKQEMMYPKAKVRHYDADKVKKYMEKQIAERKKKMKEEKQLQRKAVDERKKKLEELYNKQKKTLAANLAKNKNRMGETYSMFPGFINAPSTDQQHPYLHHITEFQVEDVMTSESDKENVDIASFTGLPYHQDTSFNKNKPYDSKSSSDLSDKAYHRPPVLPHDKEESEDEGDVTLTPVHDESSDTRTTVREKLDGKREPSIRYPGFSAEYEDSEITEVSQPSESTGYKMVMQDKVASVPTSMTSPSRSDRIAALRNTAAELKQRLEQEARRLGLSLLHQAETEQHPSSSGVSKMETEVFRGQLPGVDNLHEQAELNEELDSMNTAATKIQAIYRGHSTRQGLAWKLPSGRTLGATLREAWRQTPSDGREHFSEQSSMSSAMDASSESNGSDVETAYSHESQPSSKSQSLKHVSVSDSKPRTAPLSSSPKDKQTTKKEYRPSTTLGKSWTKPKPQGDRLSVINIYARNHLAVRKDQEPEVPPEAQDAGNNTASLYSDKTGETASLLEDVEDLKDDTRDLDKTLVRETPTDDNHGYEDDFSLESQDNSIKPSPSQPSPSPERSYTQSLSSPTRSRSSVLSQSDSDYSPTRPILKSTMRHIESEGSTYPAPSSIRPPPPLYAPDRQGGDRMSPGSLDQRLMAELNRLEFMEESVRQLTDIERTKSVSFAQQETVSLAQILKAKQSAHARDMETLQLKAKQEKFEAARQLDEARNIASRSSIEAQQSVAKAKAEAADSIAHATERLVKAQADAARTNTEAAQRVEEARTEAARTLFEAANQQIADVGKVSASAASAAAQAAVMSTLEQYKQEQRALRKQDSKRRTPDSYSEWSTSFTRSRSSRTATEGETGSRRGPSGDGYTSDEFESFKESERSKSARSVSPHRSGSRSYSKTSQPFSVSPTRERSGAHSSASIPEEVDLSVTEGSLVSDVIPDDESIAEVISEGKKPKDKTDHEYSMTFEESMLSSRTVTDDELDYRMILPSEDHRRRSIGKSYRSGSIGSDHGTISYSSDENHDGHLSDSMHDKNAPFSGEDSFSKFTSDMVNLMKEEEVRAKHQEALLHLREKALKEKTKAEMAWLELQKKRMRDKGSDDVMPSIRKRQRGVLMRLQAEKAEIKRLKAANRAASYERKLLLMQQEEIARLRKSTQKIRGKVREEEAVMSRDKDESAVDVPKDLSPTKTRDLTTPEESPSKSSTTVPEELSAIQSAADSSFPAYDDQEPSISERPRKRLFSEGESDDGVASGSVAAKSKGSPTSSDSFVMQQLKKLKSQSSERYLTQREQKLMRRRDEAEELLASQRKLIEWERRLDEEESKVCNLINEALNLSRDNRGKKSKRTSKAIESDDGRAKAPSLNHTTTPTTPSASPSKSERISSRQPSEYVKFPTGQQTKSEQNANESSIAEDLPSMAPDRSRESSIAEDIPSTAPDRSRESSIAEDIPSTAPDRSRESSIPEIDIKSKDSSVTGEYTNDTFESIDSTITRSHSTPVRIISSPKTPSIKSISRRSSKYEENKSEEDASMTEASDHSDVESRVRQLKEQLEQRKREAKRLYHERKRQRRAMLLEQEETLRKELQAVERVIEKTKAELDEPTPTEPQATQQGRTLSQPSSRALSITVEHDAKPSSTPEETKREEDSDKVDSEGSYTPPGETSRNEEEGSHDKTPSEHEVYAEDKDSVPADTSEGLLKNHYSLDSKSLAKTISDVKDLDISDRSASVVEDLSNHTLRSFTEEIEDDAKTAEDISISETSEIQTISNKADLKSCESAAISEQGSVPEVLSARSPEAQPEDTSDRSKAASEKGYSDTFESEHKDDEKTEEDISEQISIEEEEEEVKSRDAGSEEIEKSKDNKDDLFGVEAKEREKTQEEEDEVGSEGTITEDVPEEILDDSKDIPENILKDSLKDDVKRQASLDDKLNLAVDGPSSPQPSYSEDFEPSVGEDENNKDHLLAENIAGPSYSADFEPSETQKSKPDDTLGVEERSLKSSSSYSPDFEESSSEGKDELSPKESHEVPKESYEVPKESYEVPKESYLVPTLNVSEATDEDSIAEDLPEEDQSLESGSLSDASDDVIPRFFVSEDKKQASIDNKVEEKTKQQQQDEEKKELQTLQADKISNELSNMLINDAVTYVTGLYDRHQEPNIEEVRGKEAVESKDNEDGKGVLDEEKKASIWPEETGEISEADNVSISERLSFSDDEDSMPGLDLKPTIDTLKEKTEAPVVKDGGQEPVKPVVVDKQVQSEGVITKLSEDLLKEAASQMITLMRKKQEKLKLTEQIEKDEKDEKKREKETREGTVHSPELSPQRGLDKFMAVHRFSDGVPKHQSPPGSPTKDTAAFDGNELADKLSQLKLLHDELGDQLGDDDDEDNDFVVSNKPLELPSDKEVYEPPRGQTIPMVVPHDCSEVKEMIFSSLLTFYNRKKAGRSLGNVTPPPEFSETNVDDNDTDRRIQQVYRRQIFDLTGEVFRDVLNEESPPSHPSWMKPRRRRKNRFYHSLSPMMNEHDYLPVVQQRVLDLVGLGNERPSLESLRRKTPLKIGKKDAVDAILIQELREEEPQWIDYDDDELAVKFQVADAIFDSLLSETVMVMNAVQRRKDSRRDIGS